MNLTLIGTGSGDGWPVPGCPCPSCTSSRSAGVLRGPTAALLDGVLLLDGEPGTPHAAERAGVDLTRVRQALGTRPGTALRWPTSSLGTPQLVAGDRLRLDDHDIRVLEAGGGGLVLDVTGPSGRLLWAPRTGPLPAATLDALRDAELDVVVLDETTGDGPAQHGHLGLDAFAAQVRRLREAGAVTDATDVVAVHLSHDNPPTPELPRRLAAWGARVVDDGASLGPRPDPPTDRRTLVIGGARSGKSREAERLLAAEPEVEYVATAYPAAHDDEWAERVRLHQQRRPSHWSTTETLGLVALLETDGAPLLVDCLTLWLTRVMDAHGAWDDDTWATTAQKAVRDEVDALAAAWSATRRRVVAVTNEVGQGVVPDTASGRRFRDAMGHLNATLAARTEDVRWCVAGRVVRL